MTEYNHMPFSMCLEVEFNAKAQRRKESIGENEARRGGIWFAKFFTYIIILFFIVFCSCNRDEAKLTTFSGTSMEMDYKVMVGGVLNDGDREKIEQIIESSFNEVNSIYNNWNPLSEVSLINNLKSKYIFNLSHKMHMFLLLVDEIVDLCEGYFDPTVKKLHFLWKENLKNGSVPEPKDIAKLAESTGWDKINFENGFKKLYDDVHLDFCGVAKGYGIDLILCNLSDAGYENVYVEWAGDIRASGRHPEGRSWRVAIPNLQNFDEAIETLDLDRAVATSGDYMQNWTAVDWAGEKKVYTHIINPKTKQALEVAPGSIAQVTVVADTCALADGLATAVMLFKTEDEAKAFATRVKKKMPSVDFWFLIN